MLAVAAAVVLPSTAAAQTKPTVVSMGDSAISGEAGRWAGNTNQSSSKTDALGSSAYNDIPGAESTPGCHRSKAAEVHIGGDVQSVNLACSGARTYTRTSDGVFKPGLDFAANSQVQQLQTLATTNKNIKTIVVLIGANNYGFADIVQACVLDWLTSPSWWKNYCQDDSDIASRFTTSNKALITSQITGAFNNIKQAMRNAQYADGSYKLLAQTYSTPLPMSSGMRYGETGFTRQTIGGCGVWNSDVNWSRNTVVESFNTSIRNAAAAVGIPVLDMTNVLAGRRLCENTVGLLEEKNVPNWQSAGAVDNTEWVQQIRTVSTIFPPYQLQEDGHPNYWGQLALRNCFRQAYAGGASHGGICSRGTGLNAKGEPNMSLGVARTIRRMRRRIVLATILAGGLFVPPAQAVDVHRCGGAVCGTIKRPLGNGRTIPIAFRWYRAPKPTLPPIVAVEGGPGYPSTGSRYEYRGIFGPLLKHRDLLLVDNRGTGDSGLIDCPGVQGFAGRTSGPAFARRARNCARTIDRRFGRGASGRFATAYAVDDLAAVIRALKLPKVDLYGDSYGSWFAQDFAARHPRAAALADPRLDLSTPRHRPVVPVLRGDDAVGAGDRLARLGRSPRRAARTGPGPADQGRYHRRAGHAADRRDRRPAHAHRPRAGRGLGPGDLPRARCVRARRAGRRQRAAAAARRPGEHLEPLARRRRVLLARPVPRRRRAWTTRSVSGTGAGRLPAVHARGVDDRERLHPAVRPLLALAAHEGAAAGAGPSVAGVRAGADRRRRPRLAHARRPTPRRSPARSARTSASSRCATPSM